MKKIAEAAAEWATLAVTQNKKLREVPYEQLKEKLLQSGCLKESDNRGVCIDYKKSSGLPAEPVTWINDPSKLEARLKTCSPGQAIWSAKKLGTAALPYLRELLQAQDENTRKHAAFSMAILGNGEGNPILRSMVARRDGMMLEDCRKNNNLRGCMAIYWLGRLADRTITEELIRLICDPKEIERDVYRQKDLQTTRYKVTDFEGVYFQFLSHAVMALIRIGEAHPDLRQQIASAFSKAFSSEDYYGRITGRPQESSEGNMALSVKNIAFSTIKKWRN